MRRRDAERDAAPARCGLAPTSSGRPGATVRRYYERLPLAGWTRLGGRRRNPPEIDGDPKRDLRESVPSPEARSPVLKNRRRWSAGRRFRGRCSLRQANTSRHSTQGARLSALRLPSFFGERESKAQPAPKRGNAWPWLFDIQIRKTMRRSSLRGSRNRLAARVIITVVPAKAGTHTPCRT
jgi:hypothetical protein